MPKTSSILFKYGLIRYALVGTVNTVLGMGTMIVGAWLGFSYTIYTAVGYIVAFISSYILNSLFTFRVGRLSHYLFLLFVALNSTLLLAVEGVQIIIIEYIGARELTGVVLGAVVYTLTGYLMNRRLFSRAA